MCAVSSKHVVFCRDMNRGLRPGAQSKMRRSSHQRADRTENAKRIERRCRESSVAIRLFSGTGRTFDYTRVSFLRARNDTWYDRSRRDFVHQIFDFDGPAGLHRQIVRLLGHCSPDARFTEYGNDRDPAIHPLVCCVGPSIVARARNVVALGGLDRYAHRPSRKSSLSGRSNHSRRSRSAESLVWSLSIRRTRCDSAGGHPPCKNQGWMDRVRLHARGFQASARAPTAGANVHTAPSYALRR
ncbi:hypothetical protein ATER59S_00379 [Aquamicrobium terrae]